MDVSDTKLNIQHQLKQILSSYGSGREGKDLYSSYLN